MVPPARLLLTRPQAQAGDWAERLAALGVPSASLPLIQIVPAPDPSPGRAAWAQLPQARLAMFVSPNAVSHFFALRPAGLAWPAHTLAATVGPGSARALREQGVPPDLIVQPPPEAPSLDSEHLWPELQRVAGADWQGRLALLLRGDGGRDWLGERLREAGAQVQAVSVYRRQCPQLDAPQQALLQAALDHPQAHIWLFSSAEAIGHLPQLAGPGADWTRSLAIATHGRIAARAQALGCRHVVLVRPEAGEVAQAWRTLSGSTLESSSL